MQRNSPIFYFTTGRLLIYDAASPVPFHSAAVALARRRKPYHGSSDICNFFSFFSTLSHIHVKRSHVFFLLLLYFILLV
jgi:hypothetical protein